jgi:hypothetical protein
MYYSNGGFDVPVSHRVGRPEHPLAIRKTVSLMRQLTPYLRQLH